MTNLKLKRFRFCDLNLAVFSMLIHCIPFCVQTTASVAFYNIGRSFQSSYLCHFGFIQVNVNIEIHQAFTMIIAIHYQTTFQCLHLFSWIDLMAHTGPRMKFIVKLKFSFLFYPQNCLESLKLTECFVVVCFVFCFFVVFFFISVVKTTTTVI